MEADEMLNQPSRSLGAGGNNPTLLWELFTGLETTDPFSYLNNHRLLDGYHCCLHTCVGVYGGHKTTLATILSMVWSFQICRD